MVTLVLILNILISLICLYVAWILWKLRRTLAGVTKGILAADKSTYDVLHGAPKAIAKGQSGVSRLRSQYEKLESQLQKIQKVLALLSLGQRIWQINSKMQTPKRRKRRV